MAIHKRRRVGVKIDMTPMVDVAFLLLIFFMSTTQFKPPEEAQIDLPTSRSQLKLPDSDVMILAVGKGNQIYYRIGTSGIEEPGSLESLEQAVIDARIQNPRLRLAIKSDRDADYGVISDLMEILQRTGNTRFNMVTLLEEDGVGQARQ
jgi:biopolymer transport protein ExbD